MQRTFKKQLQSLDDDQLVAVFNKEVGNKGWTSSRGVFLSELKDEFLRRRIDISLVSSENSFSLRDYVNLKGSILELKE